MKLAAKFLFWYFVGLSLMSIPVLVFGELWLPTWDVQNYGKLHYAALVCFAPLFSYFEWIVLKKLNVSTVYQTEITAVLFEVVSASAVVALLASPLYLIFTLPSLSNFLLSIDYYHAEYWLYSGISTGAGVYYGDRCLRLKTE